MIIEDDADIREELCDLLEGDGFKVITAGHGAEGLEQLRQAADVRVIVLDVTMPVMNGATFRGEQLADPALASIPTILLTGRDDVVAMGTALEPAACLQKPFAPDALLQIVRSLVRD